MGMFDTVHVKCLLPGGMPDPKDCVFQTKNLERTLETYVLSKNLILTRNGKRVPYTGPFRFYRIDTDIWEEYDATVKDGTVSEITGVKKKLVIGTKETVEKSFKKFLKKRKKC